MAKLDQAQIIEMFRRLGLEADADRSALLNLGTNKEPVKPVSALRTAGDTAAEVKAETSNAELEPDPQ